MVVVELRLLELTMMLVLLLVVVLILSLLYSIVYIGWLRERNNGYTVESS